MAERMTKISGVEKVIKTTGGYGSISKKQSLSNFVSVTKTMASLILLYRR